MIFALALALGVPAQLVTLAKTGRLLLPDGTSLFLLPDGSSHLLIV